MCDQLWLRVAGPEAVWALLAGHLRGNGMLLIVENADAEPQALAAAGLAAGLRGCTLIVTGRYQRLGRAAGAGWLPVTVTPSTNRTPWRSSPASTAHRRAQPKQPIT